MQVHLLRTVIFLPSFSGFAEKSPIVPSSSQAEEKILNHEFRHDELVDIPFLVKTLELKYPPRLWPLKGMGTKLWFGPDGHSCERSSGLLCCNSSWF